MVTNIKNAGANMKRFMIFAVFILALAFITINLSGVNPAHSETPGIKVDLYEQQKLVKSVVFAIGLNRYFVDGKAEGVTMDAKPFLQEGRTFVPVRFLGNALGVEDKHILWEGSTERVTLISRTRMEMIVGHKVIFSNGTQKDIDVAPLLKSGEGRTYLPARYVAEALGYDVGWDEASQTVLCWPKGEEKPDVSAVVKKVVEDMKKTELVTNPQMPPNLLPTENSVGKPEEVKQLEGLLGMVTAPYLTSWVYAPVWEKSTWDDSIRKLANRNNNRSYFAIDYETKINSMIVEINWIRNLSDIRGVELDLRPMEKVLNWRFPNYPDKVQEIMAYTWQVAEKTRATNRTERAPLKEYYIDGWKVTIQSIGLSFVKVIIAKEAT